MKSKTNPNLPKDEPTLWSEFNKFCDEDEEYNVLSKRVKEIIRTKMRIQQALSIFNIYDPCENFEEKMNRLLPNDEQKQMAHKLYEKFLKCDNVQQVICKQISALCDNRLAFEFLNSNMSRFEFRDDNAK